MEKRDGRKIPRDAMEYMRKQAIELWKKGKDAEDIAEFFGVTIDAVYKWIRIYKNKGFNGLKGKKAPGAKPKLSIEETKELIKILKDGPLASGFENQLWDTKKIQKVILDKFNKKMHFSNVWRLLIRKRLSPQKPKTEAKEKNVSKTKKWIKEEWPKIKEHRRRWQAMLYFMDESGVSLEPVLGTTWAPIGKTPTIKVTNKRGGLCVTSAISTAGRMVFRIEKTKISSKQHIEFIQQIQKNHSNRKIIIIEDNARPHVSKMVKEYVKSQNKKLMIYYLPVCSPELNSDEHVWDYLKYVKLKGFVAKSKDELKDKVFQNMKSIQSQKNLIKAFFYGPLFV
jgi:transposase